MIPGRRVAIDVGTVLIGVAISDLAGIVASPLATIEPENLESFLVNLIQEENEIGRAHV